MSEETDRLHLVASQHAADAAERVVRMASDAAMQVLAVAKQAAEVQNASVHLDMQYIKDDLKEIKARLDSKFVSTDTFEPIRNLVYGLVALIMTGVIGAVLTLILRKP